MRIAAIDCGSNSFHLLVADVSKHDQIKVVEENKTFLYLGAEVAQNKKIGHAALLRSKRVLRNYRNIIKKLNVDKTVAVATSAIRSAENGDETIDALSKTLGTEINVISGDLEARIIFRAISAYRSLPESRILALDMGGGSLELMAGQRNLLEHAISIPLGASRVSNLLEVNDPLSANDIENIKSLFNNHVKEFKKSYTPELFTQVVVSSGTLSTIVNMARAKEDGYIPPPLSSISATSNEIENICKDIIDSKEKERKSFLAYDENRSDLIPTACVIALELLKLTKSDISWMISPYALREGLVLVEADKHLDFEPSSQNEIMSATVEDLTKKLDLLVPNSSAHSANVANIALKLFDELKQVHGLKTEDRELLKHCAKLHDIGDSITHTKHDQHGAYVLSNIPLTGFSASQASILRAVVRWHKNKTPKKHDEFFGKLSDKEFHRAKWLAAILRVADGTDCAKNGIVTDIEIAIKPDVIFLRLDAKSDCELELYSTRRKRLLLEEMTDRDLIVQQSTN